MKYFSLVLVLFSLVSAAPTTVLARSRVSIERNGARSNSSVNVSKRTTRHTRQSNHTTQANSFSMTSNTGGNKTKGNTGGSTNINSGSTATHIFVSNSGGHNYASDSSCCDTDCGGGGDSCTEEPGWADASHDVVQGTLKNGSPIIDPERTDPNAALGEADGSFFSLGVDGSIVVSFSRPVKNVEGVDLSFHEVTNDRGNYPEEKISVEVSDDGFAWFSIGEVTNNDGGDGVGYLDFDTTGLASVSYVRITDTTDYSLHDATADGYDLDAVDATVLMCE